MDPASIAALTTLVTFLKDGGPWAIAAGAVTVAWKLYGAKTEAEAGRLADAKANAAEIQDLLTRCITAMERAANTMAAVTAALESRTGIFERLAGLVEEIKALIRDLERASATADERVRDKLDANATMLRTVIDRVETLQREMRG